MGCKCAKATEEWNGWECDIIGGPCMFLVPDSKECARKYGEGPEIQEAEEINNA